MSTTSKHVKRVPSPGALPILTHLDISKLYKDLDCILTENNKVIENTVSHDLEQKHAAFFWQAIDKIECAIDNLNKFHSKIEQTNIVCHHEIPQKDYIALQEKITDWYAKFCCNSKVYELFIHAAKQDEFSTLDTTQQKVIDNYIHRLEYSGANLTVTEQERYIQLQKALKKATIQFEQNVQRSRASRALQITDQKELEGLPSDIVERAKQRAAVERKSGWLFTVNTSNYGAIIKCAKSKHLRTKMYTIWQSTATEKAYDNTPVMFEILKTRYHLSQLYQDKKFSNYAEFVLLQDKRIDQSVATVLEFLERLIEIAKPAAQKDLIMLKTFAQKKGYQDQFAQEDIAYFSKQLGEERFLSEEQVKQYFPLPYTLDAILKNLATFFDITFKEIFSSEEKVPYKWDPHVRVFEIYDAKHYVQAYLYFDLFEREDKLQHTCMVHCQTRHIRYESQDKVLQIPIAFINCNFQSPLPNQPSLMTFQEVETLLHEIGHGLQHALTQVDRSTLSGSSGISADAVEIPSQLVEKFAHTSEYLQTISQHVKTGEKLSHEMIKQLQASSKFLGSLVLLRQLSLALFDFRLYAAFRLDQGIEQIQTIKKEIIDKTYLLPVNLSMNSFENSFEHIFCNDYYAAGYYSYLRAEVCADNYFDTLNKKERGVLNPTMGKKLLDGLFGQGGTENPLVQLENFCEKPISLDFLLDSYGIEKEAEIISDTVVSS